MQKGRIWEIDLLRVIAILLMVAFHTVYDLNQYLGMDIDYLSGFWYWEGKIAALTFIFVSGISGGFSRGIVKRGVLVLGLGLGISLFTYFLLGDMYIRFGILHLLGSCMLLYPLLGKLNHGILAVLAAAIGFGTKYINSASIGSGWLLPLGIKYPGFSSADYYPLFPYLAVFILGIVAFKIYYHKKKSLFSFSLENRVVAALSKNSLWIYILHQPLIVGILLLYRYLR